MSFNDPSFETLLRALAGMEQIEDYRAFLEDLCTIKELQEMSQRFETAALLQQGLSYQEINARVGASTATICRVNRCLHYGSGGYGIALEKANKESVSNGKETP